MTLPYFSDFWWAVFTLLVIVLGIVLLCRK